MLNNDKLVVLAVSRGTYIIISCAFILIALPFVILTRSGRKDVLIVLFCILTFWSAITWYLSRLRISLTEHYIEYRSATSNLKIQKSQLIAIHALFGRKNLPLFAFIIETASKVPDSRICVSMKFFSKPDISRFLDFAYDVKIPVFVDDVIASWVKQKP